MGGRFARTAVVARGQGREAGRLPRIVYTWMLDPDSDGDYNHQIIKTLGSGQKFSRLDFRKQQYLLGGPTSWRLTKMSIEHILEHNGWL